MFGFLPKSASSTTAASTLWAVGRQGAVRRTKTTRRRRREPRGNTRCSNQPSPVAGLGSRLSQGFAKGGGREGTAERRQRPRWRRRGSIAHSRVGSVERVG